MTARCRLCGHLAHLNAGRRPHRDWDYRCREGCRCTPTYCRPVQGGSTTSKEHTGMTDQQSADDFLMSGSTPSAKFPVIGSRVEGFVTRWEVQQQRDFDTGKPKFWDDGKPQMQLAITLQTTLRDPAISNDDGQRRLYVKGQLKAAMQDAMRAAGARALEAGAYLAVTYTHDGEAKRGKAPKQYRIEYSPAAAAELTQPAPAIPAIPAAPAPAPPAPAPAPAPAAVPGLTAQQLAAAQADPTTAALLAQLQRATAAPQQTTVPAEPPF